MTRVLRGCQAALAVLLLGGGAPAYAGDLIWQFSEDNESAFLGVVDSAKAGEGNYLFYMSCAGTGDETTVISNVDNKALGAAIAKGEVPTISYLLDGQQHDNSGGAVVDIRFDELSGSWQYLVSGADYDLLLTASNVRLKGVGVDLQLPQQDMTASLQKLKSACDGLMSSDQDNGDIGGDGAGGTGGDGGGTPGAGGDTGAGGAAGAK
jgi:hypothetical protein